VHRDSNDPFQQHAPRLNGDIDHYIERRGNGIIYGGWT
jgi:hypothetical protein